MGGLLMAEKRDVGQADEKGEKPQKRETRTVRAPRDIARMMTCTAILKGAKNVATYADPVVKAFCDSFGKKLSVDAPPRPAKTKLPDGDITTINLSLPIASLVSRIAGFHDLSVPDLLNDDLIRDAATADYLSALKESLAALGWEAVRRKR